ncbi:MAG: glycosyltransferase family 8 protein [Schwartzia sp.]|nr:glycosyltransferase family 8 protein [Schwartzia sp. (in: firmicutes)]
MRNRETDEIHIVFATDDGYAQHVAVAIVSILANSPRGGIIFHIIGDCLSDEKKSKISATAENFHSRAIFYDADDDGHDFYVSAGLSRAAYARLAIAEILPGDVSRAIYLDGDLIVTDDIKKLFMHDMGDMPIAGTMDLGIMASSKRRREKNIVIGLERNEPYFNSGVLLMDIKKWRDEDYGATLIQDATAHKYPHHDQDVLNKIFMGKWSVLPLRWNVIPPVYQLHMKILLHGGYRAMAMEARERPAIIHYAGGYKPWEYERREGLNEKYYDYLSMSAFSDAPMPQPSAKKGHHSLGRQMLRNKMGSLWTRMFQK